MGSLRSVNVVVLRAVVVSRRGAFGVRTLLEEWMMTAAEHCFAFGPFRLLADRRLLLCDGSPVSIGSRCFDILLNLIENRSSLVDKDQLKQAVWSSGSIADHNVAVHVSTLRKLLDRDGERYIATVSGRGYQFVAPVDATGLARDAAAGGELPLPLTRLIGRGDDLARVARAVARNRLVTVTGAAGIGKTHLALEAARQLRDAATAETWMVELGAVAEPGQVPAAIAAALRVELYGMGGMAGVVQLLRGRCALILLDNCEHLADAVAPACEAILRACPETRILATSRAPLRCEGEYLYPLPALAVPPEGSPRGSVAALEYPAVALLAERIGSVLDGFTLLDCDAAALCEIARRLDGIPLALELAAPLLRVMTAQELAARLDDRFSLLTGGRRTALPRQQTMKAAIDWSFGMLSPAEQMLLCRLSVFSGFWTVEAAHAVVAEAPLAPQDLFELITALVDKSLVTVDLTNGQTVYRLLETTRDYAAEKQAQRGEPDLLPRLARWLAKRGGEADRDWQTRGDRAWLTRHGAIAEDLRPALAWCFGPGGDTALGLELVSVSYAHWSARSLFAERRRWFEKAVGLISPLTPPAVAAPLWYGHSFALNLEDPAALEPTLRAVAGYRQAHDRFGLGRALVRAASASIGLGEIARAEALMTEAEPMLLPGGPSRILAGWFRTLGEIRGRAGDVEAARAALRRAAEIACAIGSPRTHLDIQVRLAELEFDLGDTARAIALLRDCLDAFDEPPDRYDGMIRAVANLAAYLVAAGATEDARLFALRSLEAARIQGLRAFQAWLIERCALIALRRGRTVQAARLFGYARQHLAARRAERHPTEAYVERQLHAGLAAALHPRALAQALRHGADWSEERALDEARRS